MNKPIGLLVAAVLAVPLASLSASAIELGDAGVPDIAAPAVLPSIAAPTALPGIEAQGLALPELPTLPAAAFDAAAELPTISLPAQAAAPAQAAVAQPAGAVSPMNGLTTLTARLQSLPAGETLGAKATLDKPFDGAQAAGSADAVLPEGAPSAGTPELAAATPRAAAAAQAVDAAAASAKIQPFTRAQNNAQHPIPDTSVLVTRSSYQDDAAIRARIGIWPGYMNLAGVEYLEFRTNSTAQAADVARQLAAMPEVTGVYVSPAVSPKSSSGATGLMAGGIMIPGLLSGWGIGVMAVTGLLGAWIGDLLGPGADVGTGRTSGKGALIGGAIGAGIGAAAYVLLKVVLGAL